VHFGADASNGLVASARSGSVTSLLRQSCRLFGDVEVTWVAPSAEPMDGRAMALGMTRLADGFRFVPVVVPPQMWSAYYDDVGIHVIWPPWHGIEDDLPVRLTPAVLNERLGGYGAVNDALARRTAEVAAIGAAVSVHDYQLMLVPAALRKHRLDLRITYFNHIPFPSAESSARVPEVVLRTLVEGMLGADLIGFQRKLWADRFLECCTRLGIDVLPGPGRLRWQGRDVWVRCYPARVDVGTLAARARSLSVRSWVRTLHGGDDRTVIARVDRLDPAKNALRGFAAFHELLQREPARARAVRFVACLVPSRERVPDYRRYVARTLRKVEEVNAGHPGAIEVHLGDDQDRALGLLGTYDVLLVNAVADGMNLVAQEGAAINGADGAIVLSAGTGAADLVPATVPIDDARDVAGTAEALRLALDLSPAERRDRAARMRRAVAAAGSADWIAHQLSDLDAVAAGGSPCCPR
jgi:trehalose 6-phosphate synthase